MPNVTIARESPLQGEVVQLIEELDRYLGDLYPAESNHLLDLQSLAKPDIRFLVARRSGTVVGCGAVRIDTEGGYGEVKRMFVQPTARGGQIGRRLLERIEDEARIAGLSLLRLETGVYQDEAIALYRKQGFADRGPFGPYGPDPLSLFMEKPL
ncbi:GNAT family N-acetyltransferase [Azospirillum brasilense]|uniref:GNAT family N-acetyltransferase n=1 Tax=Azospirillum brasilense TaxID=192 RepID=A0A235H7K1_AZOBR|nr:GNAT family N-acetyltransferase [Azospirillum brasilense]OYD81759.1 GNAT family N-acetyltransferase [Azospirillum brasilense]